jgi:hypothetical protein
MEMPDVSVLFADFMNDEVLQRGWDIVLINRHIPGMELETLLDYRKRYDFKLVVDIDDYWHLDPWHILYHSYPTQKIVEHIKAADMVTCTHRRLWVELRQFNQNCHILPNALPYGRDQFHDERIDTSADIGPNRLRVSYIASVTHERDLEKIRGAFKRMAQEQFIRERTHFIICGYTDEGPRQIVEAWRRMVSMYLGGFKLNGYARAPLEPEKYMAFYCEADIVVAPLEESKFNSMKSNLKVLEAATKRLPIMTSAVQPYLDCPYAIHCKSGVDWIRNIRNLVKSQSMREEYGLENSAWCRTNFNLDEWNKARRQMYDKLIA